jgi:hypothetical protein
MTRKTPFFLRHWGEIRHTNTGFSRFAGHHQPPLATLPGMTGRQFYDWQTAGPTT